MWVSIVESGVFPHGCLNCDRAVVAKGDVSFVPDLITLKIGHCFLLSKYKNTFIWIKMYTVENSSMHSLGVWKRMFSCRVCVVLL